MSIILLRHAIGPNLYHRHKVRRAALSPLLLFTAFNAFCGTSYDSPSTDNNAPTTVTESQAFPNTDAYMNKPSRAFDYQDAVAEAERARQAILQKGWKTSPRSNSPEGIKAWREENHRVIVEAERARQSVLKAGKNRILLERIQEAHKQERQYSQPLPVLHDDVAENAAPATGTPRMEEHPAVPNPRTTPDHAPERPMAPAHAEEASFSDEKPFTWLNFGLILLLVMAALGVWLYRRNRIKDYVRKPAPARRPTVPQPSVPVDRTGVPAWAGAFSSTDYAHFMDVVQAYFQQRNIPVTLNDGMVLVTGKSYALGLQNLAGICHQATSRERWPAIIARQFDRLIADNENAADNPKPESLSFTDIANRLRVRLYPEMKDINPDNFVSRREIEGVVTMLVEDQPETMRPITRAEAKAWGKSDRELFNIALQIMSQESLTLEEARLNSNLSILFANDISDYTSSWALMLDKLKDCVGTFGSIVSVPNRHCLFVVPAETPDVLQAVHKVMSGTLELYRKGPGSISPHLYWYYQRKFTRISYPQKDGVIGLELPEAFAIMLKTAK
ncbi:hypothetical protein EV700_2665 [Fluviicoccus keumensis]|uniref:Uncharacterized protein n=1 Tax=Fluviicoccus keumensis TaxID=1435465 RepID=A0A4Q7YMW3_9GAMM|nr:hypothetical protein [Fluviicoccus keumensis]RZU38730.1 hypothetical protein EV700_2665 [Fluviicoccus keumensis]